MTTSTRDLTILKWPAAELRRTCQPIADVTDEHREIAREMIKLADGIGVGLAANQVGVMERIIVLLIGGKWTTFFNPEVTRTGGKVTAWQEECLSIPYVRLYVERPRWAEMKALDVNGKPVCLRLQRNEARALLHEIDHLNGKTILHTCTAKERRRAERIAMEATRR